MVAKDTLWLLSIINFGFFVNLPSYVRNVGNFGSLKYVRKHVNGPDAVRFSHWRLADKKCYPRLIVIWGDDAN